MGTAAVLVMVTVLAFTVGGMLDEANAQSRFGQWAVVPSTDGESLIAGTRNDSGQMLAQGCWNSTGVCLWTIGLDIGCTKDQRSDLLVNPHPTGGTATLELYCREGTAAVDGTYYRYAFTDFDKIDGLIRSNSFIGFAMALRSGEFHVVWFSLEGARQAIDTMRRAAQERLETPALHRTRDKRL
jgi:hypothetical protein